MYLRQAAANLLRRRIRFPSRTRLPIPISKKEKFSYEFGSGGSNWRFNQEDSRLGFLLFGNAAIVLGINSSPVLAEEVSTGRNTQNDTEGADVNGLRKIEDGSIISNIHTSKWRVFTDHGRDLFMQGKSKEAEGFFLAALEEAKQGFGKRDPHVASACNNLAEFYRVNKSFDKAEPLYLEAINILEETYGSDDIRVGSAFHNLGQFYLAQRKLEEARICYESSLKIKGRVLGLNHADYADTMYHLGTVLYLLGKEKDAEDLILDSVRILEEGGQGESTLCLRRYRYLAQIYLSTNHFEEAEKVQRKILHILELTKGWNSLDIVTVAEGLALTLQMQPAGSLKEAQELLERCLDARKKLLPHDHIQIGKNMLHIARLKMLNSNRLTKMDIYEAIIELDEAKDCLNDSIRIARSFLAKLMKQNGKMQSYGAPGEATKNIQEALVILLQSLDTLGYLEITKKELLELKDEQSVIDAEVPLLRCISAYQELGKEISDVVKVKAEYLSCLKHLAIVFNYPGAGRTQQAKGVILQDIKEEIKRLEAEVSHRKRRN